MSFDPAALDHQLAVLRPLAADLRAESWHRRPIAADAWAGPSADAARDLETRMLARLRDAAVAAESTVRGIIQARNTVS